MWVDEVEKQGFLARVHNFRLHFRKVQQAQKDGADNVVESDGKERKQKASIGE